ncbi:MAG: dihydroneopterin aldolase [Planctomycetaceae bacterium]|nr:dihydroneopterin aldolase [Planctomycetaceae bacterium]
MNDVILIRDLLLRAIIGINDDERRNRQDVLINIRMRTDTRTAAASDQIEDAVNYRTIAKNVIELVENSSFLLVEKLAGEVAALCLQDERVNSVQVTVEKPTALRFAASVGITIERTRSDLSSK